MLALVTLTRALLCFCLAALLVSCSDQPRPVASLGDAYVGPGTLNLRRELALKSAISATVKHGDKLAIVEYRHRLVKVRTEQGVEGWTDMRQLLTPEQMAALRDMARERFPRSIARAGHRFRVAEHAHRAQPNFSELRTGSGERQGRRDRAQADAARAARRGLHARRR